MNIYNIINTNNGYIILDIKIIAHQKKTLCMCLNHSSNHVHSF